MSTHETEHDVNAQGNIFNDDHLTVTVSRKPHCEVKFDIKVKPEAVKAAYFQTLKDVNKEVSIPGFRKGRAPNSFLEDRYASTIQKSFVELALQTAFQDAVQLTHIHPLKDGHMKRPVVHECSSEKGAHFTIEFESRPVIPSVKVEELKIKKQQPKPITDQDCESALDNLLLQFAKYEPISDRHAQENDFVDISLTILEDPPQEVIHNQRIQVNTSKGIPAWIYQKVLGLGVEESAEGMTEQNASLTNSPSDPNFQPLPFRVTVHAIWEGVLPAIDEELAKRVGLSSVEELKSKIKERLEQEAERGAYEGTIDEIERSLVEKYPIEIPQSYIKEDKEARLEHYRKLQEKEQDEDVENNFKEIDKSIEKSTIYNLQLFFLFRKIAADYDIEITSEDLSHELKYQLSLMQMNRCAIDFSDDTEKQTNQLRNLALDRKIKQFLIDHSQQEES